MYRPNKMGAQEELTNSPAQRELPCYKHTWRRQTFAPSALPILSHSIYLFVYFIYLLNIYLPLAHKIAFVNKF